MDLPFALRLYRPEVFADWLAEGLDGAELHGSYLTHLLGGPSWCDKYPAGMPDNTYAADELLKAAEGLGWLTRETYNPGHSAAAFLSLNNRDKGKDGLPSYTYPREWTWKVSRQALGAWCFALSRGKNADPT